VINVQSKMMSGNAPSVVDIAQRSTRVCDWAIKRCAEKFALHSAKFVHRGIFEKRLQFRIGYDAIIKVTDKFSDCLFAADAYK
jgi:hypothetical protein